MRSLLANNHSGQEKNGDEPALGTAPLEGPGVGLGFVLFC